MLQINIVRESEKCYILYIYFVFSFSYILPEIFILNVKSAKQIFNLKYQTVYVIIQIPHLTENETIEKYRQT